MKMKSSAFWLNFVKVSEICFFSICKPRQMVIFQIKICTRKIVRGHEFQWKSPRIWPHWPSSLFWWLFWWEKGNRTRLGRNKTMLFQLDKARHFYGEWFEQHQSKNVKQKISWNHKDLSSKCSTLIMICNK